VRRLLVISLSVLLAALLVFLIVMTQSVDFGRQVRVNEQLAALRTLDAKWNESVLRARSGDLADETLQRIARDQLGRAINGLNAEARSLDNLGLVADVARLQTLYDEKLLLMAEYGRATAVSASALGQVLETVPAAQAQIRDLRAASSGVMQQRLEDMRLLLDRLSATSMEFSAVSGDRLRQEIEVAEQTLLSAMEALPGGVRDSLRRTVATLRALREAQPRRDHAFSRLYYFPTGPRTDALGMQFAQNFQSALEQRELYRVYLIFYSAALLVLLGYVGFQLFRSYRVINLVNMQLKRANENLEQKVEARTLELSDALRHLKESEAMLVQSEKMSSLGQMVAGVAHEINTPLAYVKSSLESVQGQLPTLSALVEQADRLLTMLQTGEAGEQEVAMLFGQVSALARELREHEALPLLERLAQDGLHGIGQISDLIINLKDFSRLDRTRLTPFDLRAGLESTLKIARNLVKTREVVRRFGDIPLVACSPSQINQVFLNLITNAAQATEDGTGTIILTTRRSGVREVAVDVEDNGRGIAAEDLPRIFDPFFTTKDVGQGTGLGLSIAYKIVQEHGGRIDVESRPGKGTRFTVTLPIGSVPVQER
jgi:signal transduction histidine kinase